MSELKFCNILNSELQTLKYCMSLSQTPGESECTELDDSSNEGCFPPPWFMSSCP